jgi:hypothetical protein
LQQLSNIKQSGILAIIIIIIIVTSNLGLLDSLV